MQAQSRDPHGSIPVLIMGLGHPRQTAFLVSLHRAGIPVHAVHTEASAHRFSRRLASFHKLDPDPEAQLQHLEKFGQTTGGILIATNDDYVALVAKNRARLAKYFIIPLSDWETVDTILDRMKSCALAQSIGIKVPRIWAPDTHIELTEAIAERDPKRAYILKTRTVLSQPADEITDRQTKSAPQDAGELLKVCVAIEKRTGAYPLIQEVVPGGADSAIGVSMVVSPRGETILAYCTRRIRLATYKLNASHVHPYELGAVVWAETVHDQEAMDAARKIVDRLKYVGPLSVEFRRDITDGSLYLMKIEPRPVRATSISQAIGMDVPTALHAAFTGGMPKVASTYEDGIGWLWIQAYVRSFIRNPHNTRRDVLRILRTSHRIKAFGEDILDPVPNVVENSHVVLRSLGHAIRRLSGRTGAVRASIPTT